MASDARLSSKPLLAAVLMLVAGCAPKISDARLTCASFTCYQADCQKQPEEHDYAKAVWAAFHPVGHVIWMRDVWVSQDGPWYHVHCKDGHVVRYELDLNHGTEADEKRVNP